MRHLMLVGGLLLLPVASPARAEGVERLRGASSVVPAGDGLLSTGGPALRYLAPGASRWETLHRQAGDTLSRVAADDSGQVLAAWEKDPFIHYFVLASKQHAQLPRPKPPSASSSPFQVHSLAFSV